MVLPMALDKGNEQFLENDKSPIKKSLEKLDNREVIFYLALYWANAFGPAKTRTKELKTGFYPYC